MYRYDECDHAFVRERSRSFATMLTSRTLWRTRREQFKPLRLQNGVYLQLPRTCSVACPTAR